MNAVVKQDASGIPALQMTEGELVNVLATSLYPGAQVTSIKMAIGYCKATGLDPMQKPVHIVPMWDGKAKQMRDSIMPGIGLYRIQAARTGEHVGTDKPIFGPMVEYELSGFKVVVPEWCEVTVYRMKHGQKCAYTAQEFWIENYATAGKDTTAPNTMWKKRSRGQLAKCAEAQALRKGFPEVGNQPTAEEMDGKSMEDAAVIDGATGEISGGQKAAEKPALPAYPDARFTKNLPGWKKSVEEGNKVSDLLAMLQSKYTLSKAQLDEINAMGKQPAPADPAASTTSEEMPEDLQDFASKLD